jgi:alkanesulfonate monooxygenase SsuD/methylene tetrahydromethanopterin reductase-like flavin-dependent oxidoreductase (luciferase family)
MTNRRRGVALTPMETRREVIVKAALVADELGYEVFSVPEGWGWDAIPLLTELALRTRRIRLASGVLSVWGRSPATLAMAAATLHHLSGSRFELGLGASTRALAEGFHDVPFTRAAARLRSTVTSVRALLAGESPNLTAAPSARAIRLGVPPCPDVPISLAALSERTLQVVGELADGWLPFFVTREHLCALTGRLMSTREAAGQTRRPLTVAAGPITVAADDPSVARQVAAGMVAWYALAMGDVYGRFLSEHGYAAEMEALRGANLRPTLRGGVVPPEAQNMLEGLAAYGSCREVRDQLERWDQAADIVTLVCPPAVDWQVLEATLEAGAP